MIGESARTWSLTRFKKDPEGVHGSSLRIGAAQRGCEQALDRGGLLDGLFQGLRAIKRL